MAASVCILFTPHSFLCFYMVNVPLSASYVSVLMRNALTFCPVCECTCTRVSFLSYVVNVNAVSCYLGLR